MHTLTRRRDPNSREEAWLIFYGNVHVGTVGQQSGNTPGRDTWFWRCGFYPGSNPGEGTSGTAASFWEARSAFEAAWRIFFAKRVEADFQAWRDDRDWTARKYAMFDAGLRPPPLEWEPGKPCSIWMKCRCGTIFNSHRLDDTVVHVPHLTKAKQAG